MGADYNGRPEYTVPSIEQSIKDNGSKLHDHILEGYVKSLKAHKEGTQEEALLLKISELEGNVISLLQKKRASNVSGVAAAALDVRRPGKLYFEFTTSQMIGVDELNFFMNKNSKDIKNTHPDVKKYLTDKGILIFDRQYGYQIDASKFVGTTEDKANPNVMAQKLADWINSFHYNSTEKITVYEVNFKPQGIEVIPPVAQPVNPQVTAIPAVTPAVVAGTYASQNPAPVKEIEEVANSPEVSPEKAEEIKKVAVDAVKTKAEYLKKDTKTLIAYYKGEQKPDFIKDDIGTLNKANLSVMIGEKLLGEGVIIIKESGGCVLRKSEDKSVSEYSSLLNDTQKLGILVNTIVDHKGYAEGMNFKSLVADLLNKNNITITIDGKASPVTEELISKLTEEQKKEIHTAVDVKNGLTPEVFQDLQLAKSYVGNSAAFKATEKAVFNGATDLIENNAIVEQVAGTTGTSAADIKNAVNGGEKGLTKFLDSFTGSQAAVMGAVISVIMLFFSGTRKYGLAYLGTFMGLKLGSAAIKSGDAAGWDVSAKLGGVGGELGGSGSGQSSNRGGYAPSRLGRPTLYETTKEQKDNYVNGVKENLGSYKDVTRDTFYGTVSQLTHSSANGAPYKDKPERLNEVTVSLATHDIFRGTKIEDVLVGGKVSESLYNNMGFIDDFSAPVSIGGGLITKAEFDAYVLKLLEAKSIAPSDDQTIGGIFEGKGLLESTFDSAETGVGWLTNKFKESPYISSAVAFGLAWSPLGKVSKTVKYLTMLSAGGYAINTALNDNQLTEFGKWIEEHKDQFSRWGRYLDGLDDDDKKKVIKVLDKKGAPEDTRKELEGLFTEADKKKALLDEYDALVEKLAKKPTATKSGGSPKATGRAIGTAAAAAPVLSEPLRELEDELSITQKELKEKKKALNKLTNELEKLTKKRDNAAAGDYDKIVSDIEGKNAEISAIAEEMSVLVGQEAEEKVSLANEYVTEYNGEVLEELEKYFNFTATGILGRVLEVNGGTQTIDKVMNNNKAEITAKKKQMKAMLENIDAADVSEKGALVANLKAIQVEIEKQEKEAEKIKATKAAESKAKLEAARKAREAETKRKADEKAKEEAAKNKAKAAAEQAKKKAEAKAAAEQAKKEADERKKVEEKIHAVLRGVEFSVNDAFANIPAFKELVTSIKPKKEDPSYIHVYNYIDNISYISTNKSKLLHTLNAWGEDSNLSEIHSSVEALQLHLITEAKK